jgi:hypothetical protein
MVHGEMGENTIRITCDWDMTFTCAYPNLATYGKMSEPHSNPGEMLDAIKIAIERLLADPKSPISTDYEVVKPRSRSVLSKITGGRFG